MKNYSAENFPRLFDSNISHSSPRCLVINPPNKPFSSKTLLIEPIDVLSLATYVRSLGAVVRFVDMDHLQVEPEYIKKILAEFKPTWTIIPFDYHIPLYTSEAIENVIEIGKMAAVASSQVLVGGRPATFHPEAFRNIPGVIIAQGEMEPAIAILLKTFSSNDGSIEKIPGILHFNNGVLTKSNLKSPVFDINTLPIPDRTFTDINKYIDVHSLLSSRGCVERCGFCPVPAFWGRWRKRTAKFVVDEIEYLVNNFNAKKILFLDDHATADKRRMREISNELITRKIQVTLGCLGTIVSFDRETFSQMFDAGFRWIHYGAEFADDLVLKNLHKRHSVAQMEEVLSLTASLGYRVRSSWIIDAPSADESGVIRTIDAIIKAQTHEIRAHFFAPRAGAPLAIGHTAEPGLEVPPQYLHSGEPVVKNEKLTEDFISKELLRLTKILTANNYTVVRDPNDWENFEVTRSPADEQRFISFCPGRYGIGWRY